MRRRILPGSAPPSAEGEGDLAQGAIRGRWKRAHRVRPDTRLRHSMAQTAVSRGGQGRFRAVWRQAGRRRGDAGTRTVGAPGTESMRGTARPPASEAGRVSGGRTGPPYPLPARRLRVLGERLQGGPSGGSPAPPERIVPVSGRCGTQSGSLAGPRRPAVLGRTCPWRPRQSLSLGAACTSGRTGQGRMRPYRGDIGGHAAGRRVPTAPASYCRGKPGAQPAGYA